MNTHGNPSTLVASHPDNTNAAKYGVYSPRLLAPRAAEIVAEFTRLFEFSVTQRISVEEVAGLIATLEAIDRALDQHGVVDKHGKPRDLLNYRSRISRQLDRWLSQIAPSIERQTADKQAPSHPGRSDYVAELQRIALGYDTTASARDRLSANKELLAIDSAPGDSVVVHLHFPDDHLPRQVGDPSPSP